MALASGTSTSANFPSCTLAAGLYWVKDGRWRVHSNLEIPFQAQYIYLNLLSYETDLQRELMLWIYRFSFATEGDDIADIRMQNKQMTICENISGLFYHSV